jgi:hypothetical protein
MTAIVTLLVIALFSYLVHHYTSKRSQEIFRLERFRVPGPLTDWSPSYYYEEQRRNSDLAAIYGRSDVPDPELRSARKPHVAPAKAEANATTKARPVQLGKTGLACGNLSAPGGTLAV